MLSEHHQFLVGRGLWCRQDTGAAGGFILRHPNGLEGEDFVQQAGQFAPLGVVAAAAHSLGLVFQCREGTDLDPQFGNAACGGGLIEHLLLYRLDLLIRRFVQIVQVIGIQIPLSEGRNNGLPSPL